MKTAYILSSFGGIGYHVIKIVQKGDFYHVYYASQVTLTKNGGLTVTWEESPRNIYTYKPYEDKDAYSNVAGLRNDIVYNQSQVMTRIKDERSWTTTSKDKHRSGLPW